MQKIFEALASAHRRKILVYLSQSELSAGEIASHFDIAKSGISQHLSILENAGLVEYEKRAQSVFYRLIPDNLMRALYGFAEEACPTSHTIKTSDLEKPSKEKL